MNQPGGASSDARSSWSGCSTAAASSRLFSRGSTSAWRERAGQSEPEACAGRPRADARKPPWGVPSSCGSGRSARVGRCSLSRPDFDIQASRRQASSYRAGAGRRCRPLLTAPAAGQRTRSGDDGNYQATAIDADRKLAAGQKAYLCEPLAGHADLGHRAALAIAVGDGQSAQLPSGRHHARRLLAGSVAPSVGGSVPRYDARRFSR